MSTIEPTRFTVYPTGYDDAVNSDKSMWTLSIEQRSPGRWCVTDGFGVFTRKGREYESIPSSRTEAFLERTRFSLEEARRIALGLIDERRVNGHTLAQASVEIAERLARMDGSR